MKPPLNAPSPYKLLVFVMRILANNAEICNASRSVKIIFWVSEGSFCGREGDYHQKETKH